MSTKQTILMILDGFGLTKQEEGNAISKAHTPNLDKLKEYAFTKVNASGLDVGLPEGQMGNSEVGHLNIGAGRIVYQELTRITKSIEDKDFFEKEEFLEAIKKCKSHKADLHLYGLLSDGGVHSHISHLYGLLEFAKKEKFANVYVHVFLDGRDTSPASGKGYIEQLQNKMNELQIGKIATIMGRYYAMDRDNRWERVELAYNAMVLGEGHVANDAMEAIQNSYSKEVYDEFVIPTIIMDNGKPVATIKEKDTIIFYNFRPDRAREITRTFCDEEFTEFIRKHGFFEVNYVCMTEYDISIPNKSVVFKPQSFKNTLGEYISDLGLTQCRIAETEKYAHVTFFFNGGEEEPNKGEDRILIPSPKVATYDLKPEMSAYELTEKLNETILSEQYDLIVINYANCDMVGHTGKIDATVKAVETVDECLGKVLETVLSVNAQMLICADHGNAEQMVDYNTKTPFTAHTVNQVPIIIVNYKQNLYLKENGKLADIAPTILEMMSLEKPEEMTGVSLIS